jgi:dTDP-4-dehydrorhamnose 3,5-epimerase
MEALSIEGAWTFKPQLRGDDRGTFLEAFRGSEFAADLGYRFDVAQVNVSVSRRGVIRGIHYSDVPPGQAKYVTCVWEAVHLDEDRRVAVFLAEGLGHGFIALTDDATVLYMCSTPYAPGREHGVNPLDPALGIDWPLDGIDGGPVLSAKDVDAPTLDEALRAGQLPTHQDCAAYAGKLRGQAR